VNEQKQATNKPLSPPTFWRAVAAGNDRNGEISVTQLPVIADERGFGCTVRAAILDLLRESCVIAAK